MQTDTFRLRTLPLVLILAVGFAACSNPVEEEHEDHPVAFSIRNAQGQAVVTALSSTNITGQLTGSVGSAQTYTVVAIGEDGDELTVDGEELAVGVSELPQHATVEAQGGTTLVVTGLATGAGTVRVELLHDGHAELGGDVPVVIQ